MNTMDQELQMALDESKVLHQQYKENLINDMLRKDNLQYHEIVFQLAFLQLNDFQKEIFFECIDINQAGMSLPLGTGKTLLSLCVCLYRTINNTNPILVCTSKSLISNWESEIKKFFGNELKYEVVHKSMFPKKNITLWKIKPDTKVILITADTLADQYKQYNVDKKFITKTYVKKQNIYINEYIRPTNPFLDHTLGGGMFYSVKWACLIVDEVQKYTNIDTLWCQSLGAICSDCRWVLSGTMFDEPSLNRILGYYVILNAKGKPRSLPEIQKYVSDVDFKGFYDALREKADDGVATIVKSSDPLELAGLCDRVVVMLLGRIVYEIQGADLGERRIVEAIVGSGLGKVSRETEGEATPA